MKIVFLFCALAVFVSLIELHEGRLISKRHHPFSVVSQLSKHVKRYAYEVIRGHRTKRSSCVDDLTEASSDRFINCQTIAQEFDGDQTVSEDDINNFCDNDCGNLVVDLLNKITADCGFSPGDVDQSLLDLLSGSCASDPHNNYCLLDWENDESYSWETDYSDCLGSSDDQQSCARDCQSATKGIINDYGCCSSYIVDLSPDDYLSDSVFKTCKVKVPEHCG